MVEPKLEKSKRWVHAGLAGVRELHRPVTPLAFTLERLDEDMRRLESELGGWVLDDLGEKMIVVSERDPELRNFVYVEMLDASTGERLGHVTLLFRPEVQDFFIGFLNLKTIQGRGFGRSLAEKFRGFIPAGVRMNCVVEEAHTRKMLTALTQDLMAKGEITDWTVASPLRPAPKEGESVFLPADDQAKLEACFLENTKQVRTPILGMLRAFCSTFYSLRGCLGGNGHFSFVLTVECQPLGS